GGPFHPTFGGFNPSASLAILCGPSSYDILKAIDARSTDIEGDADTDEDDENALRAAIGTAQSQFDLDFNGTVDAADLAILITEEKRHVVQNYAASAWNNSECSPSPPAWAPVGGYASYPPAAITDLAAVGEQLSWTAPGDDGSTGYAATRY